MPPPFEVVRYPVPDASAQSPPSAVYQATPAAQAATMTPVKEVQEALKSVLGKGDIKYAEEALKYGITTPYHVKNGQKVRNLLRQINIKGPIKIFSDHYIRTIKGDSPASEKYEAIYEAFANKQNVPTTEVEYKAHAANLLAWRLNLLYGNPTSTQPERRNTLNTQQAHAIFETILEGMLLKYGPKVLEEYIKLIQEGQIEFTDKSVKIGTERFESTLQNAIDRIYDTLNEPTEAKQSLLTADAGGSALESTSNLATKENDLKPVITVVARGKLLDPVKFLESADKLAKSGIVVPRLGVHFKDNTYRVPEFTKIQTLLRELIRKVQETGKVNREPLYAEIANAVDSDDTLKSQLPKLHKDVEFAFFAKNHVKMIRCRAALFSRSEGNTFKHIATSRETHLRILLCMDILLSYEKQKIAVDEYERDPDIVDEYLKIATRVNWSTDGYYVTTKRYVHRLKDVWPIVPTLDNFKSALAYVTVETTPNLPLSSIDEIDTVALAGVQNPLLKYDASSTPQDTRMISDAYKFTADEDVIPAYKKEIAVFEEDQENNRARFYFELLPKDDIADPVLRAKLFLLVRALLYKRTAEDSEVWLPRTKDRIVMIRLNAILDLMLAATNDAVIKAYLEEAVKLTWSQEKITFPEEYRQQLHREFIEYVSQQNPSPSTPASEDIVSIETATEALRTEIAALIEQRDRIATQLTGATNEEITTLINSKTALEEQLTKLNAATEKKTQELETVASAFENQKKEIEAERTELQRRLEELQSQLTNGNTQIGELDKTQYYLLQQIKKSKEKLKELGEREANIEENLKQLETNFNEREAELDAKLKEKQAELDQAQEEALGLSYDELNNVKAQIDEAKKMLKKLESRNSDLDKQATQAETERASKVTELKRLQEQQKTQTAEFMDKAAKQTAELQELEEQRSVLQKTNEALINQNRVTDKDIADAERHLEETKAATEAAINELEALKRQALDALAQHEYTIKTATGKFTNEPRSAINDLLDTHISGSEYTYRYIVERPSLFLRVKNVIRAFEPVSDGNNTLKFAGDELVATVGDSNYTILPVIS